MVADLLDEPVIHNLSVRPRFAAGLMVDDDGQGRLALCLFDAVQLLDSLGHGYGGVGNGTGSFEDEETLDGGVVDVVGKEVDENGVFAHGPLVSHFWR